jgi:uncharacterized membrane protein YbhN (UPF0104 family)
VKATVRWIAGLVVAAASLWFMASQLHVGAAQLGVRLWQIPVWALFAAAVFFAASQVMETFIWHRLLRTVPGQSGALSLSDTFAVLNVSAVGKYLPGKVWGYAWQMFLLDRRGVPPQASLRTNVLTIVAAFASGALVGALASLAGGLPLPIAGVSLLGALALIAIVPLHERLRLVTRIGARFGIRLDAASVSRRAWALTIAGYCAVWVVYGSGGALLALVLDPSLGVAGSARVLAGMSLSWLVGMVVIIAPAGLGVREAAMAFALAGMSGSLGAVLPIATRLILILVDLALEVAALTVMWRRRPLPQSG